MYPQRSFGILPNTTNTTITTYTLTRFFLQRDFFFSDFFYDHAMMIVASASGTLVSSMLGEPPEIRPAVFLDRLGWHPSLTGSFSHVRCPSQSRRLGLKCCVARPPNRLHSCTSLHRHEIGYNGYHCLKCFKVCRA